MGQLGAPEQFVLWALRQRCRDRATASAALVGGFRLAFNLAYLESGLAAFEELFRAMTAGHEGGIFPLTSVCISAEEEAVIELLASAQLGGPLSLPVMASEGLRLHASRFACLLLRAELRLASGEPCLPALH